MRQTLEGNFTLRTRQENRSPLDPQRILKPIRGGKFWFSWFFSYLRTFSARSYLLYCRFRNEFKYAREKLIQFAFALKKKNTHTHVLRGSNLYLPSKDPNLLKLKTSRPVEKSRFRRTEHEKAMLIIACADRAGKTSQNRHRTWIRY